MVLRIVYHPPPSRVNCSCPPKQNADVAVVTSLAHPRLFYKLLHRVPRSPLQITDPSQVVFSVPVYPSISSLAQHALWEQGSFLFLCVLSPCQSEWVFSKIVVTWITCSFSSHRKANEVINGESLEKSIQNMVWTLVKAWMDSKEGKI